MGRKEEKKNKDMPKWTEKLSLMKGFSRAEKQL